MEKWKPVKGWKKLYSVSDHGRVKSHDRTIIAISPWGQVKERRYHGRILSVGNTRYPVVSFTHPKKRRQCFNVHDLVAFAFLGPKPKGYEVCHRDDNGKHNHISNIRYGTRASNFQDRICLGTFKPMRGSANGNSKLTDKQIFKIRGLHGMFSQRELARQFKVSHTTIGQVLRNQSYKT